jgi:hypothetical protein
VARDRYGIKFSKSAVKRLGETTRYVEQQPRNQVAPPAGGNNFGGVMTLLVTTALNPMSGATPGANGRGKIQKLVSGSYSDFSTTVFPILNDTEKTVAIGAYVLCAPGAGGMFHLVVVDKCANLS